MLGNTALIGLAIAPLFVSDQALALVVFYSIQLLAPEFFVIKC